MAIGDWTRRITFAIAVSLMGLGLAAGAQEAEEESPCKSACFETEGRCFDACSDAEDMDACDAKCEAEADACLEKCE